MRMSGKGQEGNRRKRRENDGLATEVNGEKSRKGREMETFGLSVIALLCFHCLKE